MTTSLGRESETVASVESALRCHVNGADIVADGYACDCGQVREVRIFVTRHKMVVCNVFLPTEDEITIVTIAGVVDLVPVCYLLA